MRKLIVLSIILGIALQTTAFAIQEPTSTSTKKIRISRNKKDQIREYTLPAYWSSYNDEYLNEKKTSGKINFWSSAPHVAYVTSANTKNNI